MTAHSIADSAARDRVTRGARFRRTDVDPADPWGASLEGTSTPFGRANRSSPTADAKVKAAKATAKGQRK